MTLGQGAAATVQVGAADDELATRLTGEVNAFNVRVAGADQAALSVRVSDPAGTIVGGLTGWTWGGCGGVGLLWVRAESRREGWGGRLLRAAEEEARRRGCTRMLVSSQSPGFYRRYGYVETGRTEGLPGGHCDVHFVKRLGGAAAPRLRVVVVIDIPARYVDAAQRYEDLVLPLLADHSGRLERRLRTTDSGAEVHLLSFASREGYDAYLADPRRIGYHDGLGGVRLRTRILEVDEVYE